MDINGANLSALSTMISTSFNERLTGVETTHAKISMTVRSTTAQQGYPKLSEIPSMREWVGPRQINRLEADGFVIKNRKFENTIAVSVDEIADDSYGVYAPIASDFGQSAAELPDELVWEHLATGFDTAHYDGANFFDTEHPVEDESGVEQSVSNLTAGAGPAWYLIDTTRVTKPIIFQNRQDAQITPMTSLTDDNVFHQDEFMWGAKRRCAVGFGAWQLIHASQAELNAANYEAARNALGGMRGHKGRKLNLRGTLLVVPQQLEGRARKLLKAQLVDGGDDNVWYNSAELHVETRL